MTDLRRNKNIQWTASGDYSWDPEPCDSDLYNTVVAGLFRKYYDASILSDFSSWLREKHPEAQMFLDLLHIPMEEGAYRREVKERPVLKKLRKDHAEDILRMYDYSNPHDEVQLMEQAHNQRILHQVPKVSPMSKRLLNDLEDLGRDHANTESLVRGMMTLIKRNFHVNPTLKDEEKLEQILEKERKPEENPDFLLEQFNITSAEFTGNIFLDAKDSKFDDSAIPKELTKSEEKLKAFLESIYGTSILSLEEEDALLKVCRTKNHEQAKLLITHGEGPKDDQYHARAMRDARKQNIEAFEKRRLAVDRTIRRLSAKLRESLEKDRSDQRLLSDHGELVASRIWRNEVFNDFNLFANNKLHDSQKIMVDLLLDASASQQDRMQDVAIQGYMIAKALKDLNIPLRATSFQSQQGYTIIRQYLDYDTKDSPENLFSFFPSAANRDGFAYRITANRMKKRTGYKNILIVLSDGKPYDERITQKRSRLREQNYSGDFAIKDSAKEIRALRNRDIAVLGIFTGLEEDVEAAKKIFGQHFAYIRNMNRFAELIAKYLREEILS